MSAMTYPYAIPWDRMGRWLWRNPGSIVADCIQWLLGFAASRLVALLRGFEEFRFSYRYSLDYDDVATSKRHERLIRYAERES